MAAKIHTEDTFETAIAEHLVAHGGYREGDPKTFDNVQALFPKTLVSFVQDSQPDAWAKLKSAYGAKADEKLLDRVARTLDQEGTLSVLRHGVKDINAGTIRLAFFKPASGLNPETQALYDENVLEVTRQVHHSPKKPNDAVDLVLSVNGVPVATAELKNPFTGQTVKDAIHQYKVDRHPSDGALLKFKTRALIHFAVDPDLVYMATKLAGSGTYFLPFNKGRDGGAGNPHNPDGYATSYLWEHVWAKGCWLDILNRFVLLEVKEKKDDAGKTKRSETLIFPRYHQLDVVNKLVNAAQASGPGRNYLVQHSAGSGKSNSIGWLAHRLSSLHDATDAKVYNSVVIITDRRVLDQQLRDNIYQVEHKQGVVQAVREDKGAKSGQLAEALNAGKPIIICTLQSFSAMYGSDTHDVLDQSDKRFAVIVDEAHGSQHGTSAEDMRRALGAAGKDADTHNAEDTSSGDVDPLILQAIQQKGPQPNLSFFAFTATPKKRTLETFGEVQGNGSDPQAFHVYSMRQAIEEDFIKDVLKYYTTYKTFYRLSKAIEDDPLIDATKAKKAIARFMSLHPHHLGQKTEVIIEHFRQHTRQRIGGKAKAMIVTSSRLHAVRYYREITHYIADKGYDDIGVLVAFSGTVTDSDLPPGTNEFTESGLNGFSETELPEKFDTDDHHLLIVAEKYQTGFDQPLLHTMYVDKRLKDLAAVQTLSRLNRTHPAKEDTFVLDFVNEAEDIKEAFAPFYEVTQIDEPTDPNLIYTLKSALEDFQYFWKQEVDDFAAVFFKAPARQRAQDQGKLYASVAPAVQRFTDEPDEDRQEDFRGKLVQYIRLYAMISQMVTIPDVDLEKLYVFARALSAKLPKREGTGVLKLDDEIELEYYRLQKKWEGSASLDPGDDGTVSGPTEVGTSTGFSEPEQEPLSKILDIVNKRFETDFKPEDKVFLEQMVEDGLADDTLRQQARANTEEQFQHAYDAKSTAMLVKRMERNEDIVTKLMKDADLWKLMSKEIGKEIFRRVNEDGSNQDGA